MRQILYNTPFQHHCVTSSSFQCYRNCDISLATCNLKQLISLMLMFKCAVKRLFFNLSASWRRSWLEHAFCLIYFNDKCFLVHSKTPLLSLSLVKDEGKNYVLLKNTSIWTYDSNVIICTKSFWKLQAQETVLTIFSDTSYFFYSCYTVFGQSISFLLPLLKLKLSRNSRHNLQKALKTPSKWKLKSRTGNMIAISLG